MASPALYDRVRETTTTTGTGTVTLLGAVQGYQSFAVVGDGNTCYYTLADQGGGPNWEVGLGTYHATARTLDRTTVFASANAGALVAFGAGTKDVFLVLPAEADLARTATANLFMTGAQTIQTGADATKGLVLKGNSGTQTADLLEAQTSASKPRARITAACEYSNPATNDNTGSANEMFGPGSGAALTTGAGNVGMGYQALPACTTGNYNVGVGEIALNALTTGTGNFGLGFSAYRYVVAGSYNIGIGYLAGGVGAGVTGPSYNCAIGIEALGSVSGSQNVGIGALAGNTTLTTGTGNVLIGYGADTVNATDSEAIALGFQAIATGGEFGLSPYTTVQTFYGYSSTSVIRARADKTVQAVNNTDATRTYRFLLRAWDTAAREVLRGEADGTKARIGFLGAVAAVQQTGGVKTAATTYGTNEQSMLQAVYNALRTFGLLS